VTAADTAQRLRFVFSVILELPIDQIDAELSPKTCEKWDSLNQIHLVNGIEEEFGFQMDFEDQMRLQSFEQALEIVNAASAR
jgi:acyl carrier protein